MILSVSRRTDIPAFYSEWFFRRLCDGFVDVRNPMNARHISRIRITPDVVDCMVFWTKNPRPMISRLEELRDYNYYFQVTVNPYDKSIEPGVPGKSEIISAFQDLSSRIGAERMIWRYDPILLTESIDVDYHLKYFEELARRLSGFSGRCVISFVDLYGKTVANTRALRLRALNEGEIRILAAAFAEIAAKHGFELFTCAEAVDLKSHGIEHGHCVDPMLIGHICGYNIDARKDKSQREECGCVESIDIGEYNTCSHGCAYCYANFNADRVRMQSSRHIVTSTLLTGQLRDDDIIKERAVRSLKSSVLF